MCQKFVIVVLMKWACREFVTRSSFSIKDVKERRSLKNQNNLEKRRYGGTRGKKLKYVQKQQQRFYTLISPFLDYWTTTLIIKPTGFYEGTYVATKK